MLRTSSRLKLLTLCLIAHAGLAAAQSQAPETARSAQTPSRPSQQPPQLDRIEPGSDVPATTIPPKERTRITEKRNNSGQVTEVEVQTSPNNRYIMKPHNPPGNAQPGDGQSGAIRAPQWQVMEFDFGNPKKQAADPATAAPSPAPAKAGVPVRADAPPPPPLEPVEKK